MTPKSKRTNSDAARLRGNTPLHCGISGGADVCLNCGCLQPNLCHHDTDIVLSDLLAAAGGHSMDVEEAAYNIPRTLQSAIGVSPVESFGAMFERPTLYMDIDNTLANLSDAMAVAVNAAFGTQYESSAITTYRWADTLPKEQGAWLTDYLSKPAIFYNLSPIIPAIRCVQKADAAGYGVIVITDRDPSLENVTREWLSFYNVQYDELIMKTPGKTKADQLSWHDEDDPAILIDDNPLYGHLLANKPGVTVLQPEWPYSQEIPGVELFTDWHYVKHRLGI